ncbi:hypothetical protein GCM10009504_07000 [Pseudomonas laurentiana]|nr:hypothetical protein GCM10009504_07000 [Pseudomonas laurentiana]
MAGDLGRQMRDMPDQVPNLDLIIRIRTGLGRVAGGTRTIVIAVAGLFRADLKFGDGEWVGLPIH